MRGSFVEVLLAFLRLDDARHPDLVVPCQFLPGLRLAGWGGALAAWLGFTAPAAVIVAQAVWGMARSLCPDRPRAGVAIAAAVGVLLAALYDPVWTGAMRSNADVALGLAAFGLLVVGRVSPVVVVALAAAAGWRVGG
ncbi:MAG TPA: chromate transporter [Variovorax sp.]|nr:chromate transporter [Variovorax sp.]